MTWQPIETAPRDADELTPLLVVAVDEHYPSYDVAYVGWEEGGRPVWFNGDVRVEPTHWQPLPEPPSTNPTLDQAIADVTAGKMERVNAPGQWTVSMQDGRAVVKQHGAT